MLFRSPLLLAGAVILVALLERLGTEELTVSEAGLREGAILVRAVTGAGWRDRLTSLVVGWEAELPETATPGPRKGPGVGS